MGRTREAICMGVGILVGITLCGPAAQAATEALTATRSTQPIYVDGVQVSMTAYSIGGNNYVKLRDVGKAVGYSPRGHKVNRGVTRRYGARNQRETWRFPADFLLAERFLR